MKRLYNITLIVFFLLFSCCHVQEKETYATSFFNFQLKKLKEKKIENRMIYPTTDLDSILQTDTFHVARTFDKIQFCQNDSSLIFLVRNNKEVKWSEADKNCTYCNNLIVVFMKNNDRFVGYKTIRLPLNQGIMALNFIDLQSQNKHLYLLQYGGNPLGAWGTEMAFERMEDDWILCSYKLFTTTDELTFKEDKLIWCKQPTKKIKIETVCFSELFAPKELEWVLDGVYAK